MSIRANLRLIFVSLVVAVTFGCEDSTSPDDPLVSDTTNMLLNAGFERGVSNSVDDWFATVVPRTADHVTFRHDSTERHSGNYSASISIAETHPSDTIHYSWGQSHAIAGNYVIGGIYEVSGWIKTNNLAESAWIMVQLWSGATNELLSGMNSSALFQITGTSDWTYVHQRFSIPQGATTVTVRAGLTAPANFGGTAWFDDIAVRPIDVPPDTATVNPAWSAWIRENAHAISSLTSDTYSDLQFLESLLENRRLVQLGESGHGVAEFDAAKVRLIKYLHQELGYNVIAFESSIFDCYWAYELVDRFSAEELMKNSIYGVWWAQETLPLFEYIKETQQTDRPLILAGYDMKPSSPASQNRPRFFRNVLSRVNDDYARDVEILDNEVYQASRQTWDNWLAYLRDNRERLEREYSALVDSLVSWEQELADAWANDLTVPKIALRTAWSITQEVAMRVDATQCGGTAIRDSAMAENVGFLLDELFPNEKIISWAHNFHIRHNNQDTPGSACPTMGGWLAQRYRSELYTVGLYMYEGQAATNSREVYRVESHNVNSVESVMHETGYPFSFVDMLFQTEDAGNSWMFEQVETLSWGRYPRFLVPRDQYDAILFVEQVNSPTYVN